MKVPTGRKEGRRGEEIYLEIIFPQFFKSEMEAVPTLY